MESKGNRQMVALSSPPLPFQERKPGLPGFAVSLHDERGCVEECRIPNVDAGAWGLISVTWKGEKERQVSEGPSLLCCPRSLLSRTPSDPRQSLVPLRAGLNASAKPVQLPAGAELARGGGLTGTSCLGEGRVCSWELAANSLSYAGGMLLGALLSCVPQKSLGRTSASH